MPSPLPALIKLRRFEVEEQQRGIAQLQAARDRCATAGEALEIELAMQRALASGDDAEGEEARLALPAYLAAALKRRGKLEKQLAEFDRLLDAARDELQRLFEALKAVELAREAELARARVEAGRQELAQLDETAAMLARRNTKEG